VIPDSRRYAQRPTIRSKPKTTHRWLLAFSITVRLLTRDVIFYDE
jgi:hypothetical protein